MSETLQEKEDSMKRDHEGLGPQTALVLAAVQKVYHEYGRPVSAQEVLGALWQVEPFNGHNRMGRLRDRLTTLKVRGRVIIHNGDRPSRDRFEPVEA